MEPHPDAHALLPRAGDDAVEVEALADLDRHVRAVVRAARPAVPPAVDRVVGPAHLGGEVHELEREVGGEGVVRIDPPVPARRARLDPAEVEGRIRRRVEVQDEVVAVEEVEVGVRADHHAPRARRRRHADDGDVRRAGVGVRQRGERRLQRRRAGLLALLRGAVVEAGPVREIRLAEGDALRAHVDDGGHADELLRLEVGKRAPAEVLFLRVAPAAVGREPAVHALRETPFGLLAAQLEAVEAGLLGDDVAEGDTLVVGAEDEREEAPIGVFEVERQLVRVVAHGLLPVETRRPGFVQRPAHRLLQAEAAPGLLVDEIEPQARGQDEGSALARRRPRKALLHLHVHPQRPVGRNKRLGRAERTGTGRQGGEQRLLHRLLLLVLSCEVISKPH